MWLDTRICTTLVRNPLTDFLYKNSGRWTWTPQAEEAFHKLKEAFSHSLQLGRPDPDLPRSLKIHTSEIGISAFLFQVHSDESKSILSYQSAKFSPTATRYEKSEKIVWPSAGV